MESFEIGYCGGGTTRIVPWLLAVSGGFGGCGGRGIARTGPVLFAVGTGQHCVVVWLKCGVALAQGAEQ